MKKRAAKKRTATPAMMAELAMASLETIYRRSMLVATGACSAAEYQRMVAEKVTAGQLAALAAMRGGRSAAVMAPFLKRARANAKRLRAGRTRTPNGMFG